MDLFQGPEKLARDLVQGLEYCYLANTLGSIFLHQPITYPLFFPEASVKRQQGKDLGTSATKKRKSEEGNKQKGAIINTTGMALPLRGLRGTYCRDFLDSNRTCRFGTTCSFVHAKVPAGILPEDLPKLRKLVKDTEGLSWAPTVVFNDSRSTTATTSATTEQPGVSKDAS